MTELVVIITAQECDYVYLLIKVTPGELVKSTTNDNSLVHDYPGMLYRRHSDLIKATLGALVKRTTNNNTLVHDHPGIPYRYIYVYIMYGQYLD